MSGAPDTLVDFHTVRDERHREVGGVAPDGVSPVRVLEQARVPARQREPAARGAHPQEPGQPRGRRVPEVRRRPQLLRHGGAVPVEELRGRLPEPRAGRLHRDAQPRQRPQDAHLAVERGVEGRRAVAVRADAVAGDRQVDAVLAQEVQHRGLVEVHRQVRGRQAQVVRALQPARQVAAPAQRPQQVDVARLDELRHGRVAARVQLGAPVHVPPRPLVPGRRVRRPAVGPPHDAPHPLELLQRVPAVPRVRAVVVEEREPRRRRRRRRGGGGGGGSGGGASRKDSGSGNGSSST